ncbi:MAG: transporter ATP-binding protein [Bacilli bacterium]|nr:transporter ATP-binding protein [Bacilli bacterium]
MRALKLPILSVKGLGKQIKGRDLVQDLSFDVYEQEVFGFLGANGAGKTTTIRMIVGLIKPTAGDVFIGGASIKTHFEQAMQHVGCIVENPEFYDYLTGYENLQQFARMTHGISPDRLQQIIQQVDLEHAIHDPVGTYSLGMRQRLGIAQALLGNPKLLILDEPTNGLDPAGIRELRDFIKRLAKEQQMAVLVSSHLLAEVEAMCDRVAILHQGQLITAAPVDELLKSGSTGLIRFKGEPRAQMSQLLTEIAGVRIVDQEDDAILVQLLEVETADVVEQLVRGGVRLKAVETRIATLEDLFLSLTGGTRIHALG